MGGSFSKKPPPSPAEPAMSPLEASKWALKVQKTKLDSLAKAHQQSIAANTRNLREALQRGDQTLARRYATLNLMKTKLRERAIGQLSSLDTLLLGINAAEDNRAQLEAIKRGTEEIKSMMVSVEEAEGVVSDSQEALDMVDKVSLALSLPISNSDTISKEVDSELAVLIGETKQSSRSFVFDNSSVLESRGTDQTRETHAKTHARYQTNPKASHPSGPERIAITL